MEDSDIRTLSNDELRNRLINHGHECGPITGTTRKVYENKLKRLLSGGTPSGHAISTPSTDGKTSTKSRVVAANRSGDYFGDASENDDLLEGEESFRYIPPDIDTPTSPYSAMGGSLTHTPTSRTHHLDYGLNNDSPSKSTSIVSRLFGSTSPKSSTVSYHTVGSPYGDVHRRNVAPVVAPRTAVPTIPYSASETNVLPFNRSANGAWAKAKQWAPTIAKILGILLLIIFVVMVLKRALKEAGYYNSNEDKEVQQLPA